ncbi:MAG: hypothetical protein ACOY5B_15825 [Spirochaetota bacterium]
MNNRILFFIGAMLVATALALLQTYPEYRFLSDLVVFFIGVVGGLISIAQFFQQRGK